MPKSVHGQLTAVTVATVTLDGDFGSVEILNRDGTAEIYALIDSGSTNPTVGGNDTEVLPAAIGSVTLSSLTPGATQVKLISAGTPKYSVKGV